MDTTQMSNASKYHPTKACVDCGHIRRIYCRGLCCACYLAARDKEQPGFLAARRSYMRKYMRTYERECTYKEYIDPMRAIKILVAFFEAHDVKIDDLCEYIAMSRKLHARDGQQPDKHHRKWGAKCRAS
jgi:hypothetical protein